MLLIVITRPDQERIAWVTDASLNQVEAAMHLWSRHLEEVEHVPGQPFTWTTMDANAPIAGFQVDIDILAVVPAHDLVDFAIRQARPLAYAT